MQDIKNSYLPKKYHSTHLFCLYLHDDLVNCLKQGDEYKIWGVKIKLIEKEHKDKFKRLKGEKSWHWLEENGYLKDLYFFTFKNIIGGLTSDLCNFLYTGMEASIKGKLTVSYALLRKPFKDNLFYLQWLLARPGDFLSKFYSGRGFQSVENIQPELKKEIIGEALDQLFLSKIFTTEFIYSIIYDKKDMYSFEPLFEQANHLITSCKHFQTNRCNFNFVFSNDENIRTQWLHLYSNLPLLCFYANEIILSLFDKIAKPEPVHALTNLLFKISGLALWAHRFEKISYFYDYKSLYLIITKTINYIIGSCPSCKTKRKLTTKDLINYYLYQILKCPKCGYRIDFKIICKEVLEKMGSKTKTK